MQIPTLQTWSFGEEFKSADFNNLTSVLQTYLNTYGMAKDQNDTVTGVWTFATPPVIASGLTVGSTLTVSAGGVVVTLGGLTVNQGGAAVVGNVVVTGLIAATSSVTGVNLISTGTLAVTGVSNLGGALAVTGTITATGQVNAGSYVGIGTGLTALSAANITAGGTLPALNGSNLTALNASALATGSVPTGLLPTSYSALSITTLNVATINSSGAAVLHGLTVQSVPTIAAVGGAPGTVPAFVAGFSDECVSTVAGTGATRYLYIADGSGNSYKIPMQFL